jgi:hypothetical protein
MLGLGGFAETAGAPLDPDAFASKYTDHVGQPSPRPAVNGAVLDHLDEAGARYLDVVTSNLLVWPNTGVEVHSPADI